MIIRARRFRNSFLRSSVLRRAGVAVVAAAAVTTAVVAAAPAQAAPAWMVRSVPNTTPKQAHAQLRAVSCPSSTFCLGVGSHVALDGRYAPLTESFDGKSWHVVGTAVAGSGADGFQAVSCTDRSFCMGTTSGDSVARVARWNGKAWTLLPLATAHVTALSDVQCRSHSNCTLVGSVGQAGAVWRWNGTSWHRQTLPSSPGRSLSAVSCPSTTVCYVAGASAPYTGGSPSVLRWNGSSWHTSALPKITGRLNDISCVSTTRCTAIGSRGANEDAVLVADLARGKWTYSSVRTTTSGPTGQAVACTASACTAIVSYYNSEDAVANSIAVRGRTGGFVKSAQSFPDLNGLSCSGTSCIVVGSTLIFDRSGYTIASQATPATAYRRHGLKLARFSVPQPDGRTPNDFAAVSCAGGLCAAIDVDGSSGTVWLRASATAAWKPVAGTAHKPYVAVSCSATPTVFCMAVGRGTSLRYDPASGSTGWTSAAIPQPQGKGKDDIFGVSCVSRIWCEAVGTTGTDGQEGTVLSAHWSGSSWSVDHTGSLTLSALAGISCVSIDDCLAVGYHYGAGGPKPIVQSLHQGTWANRSTTGLPSTTALQDVSCWSATGCMVTSPGDYGAATAATWNGVSFTTHPIAGDTPTANDVSCTAANSCTVVGVYFGVNRYGSQLVEHWDGAAWHIVPTPAVTGDQPVFNSVSCAASGSCTAVGYVSRAYDIALVASGTV